MNMTERFKKYLEAEFRKISPTKAAMEYRKDTLVKLEELAQDYRIKGMTDDEAIYNSCISSLGDFEAKLKEFEKSLVEIPKERNTRKTASLLAVSAVAVLVIVYLALSITGVVPWARSWLIILGAVIAAYTAVTVLVILKGAQNEKYLLPRMFLAGAIVLWFVFAYLIVHLCVPKDFPYDWMTFLIMVIVTVLADVIFGFVTKNKLTVPEALLWLVFSAALIYVMCGVAGLMAWGIGWLLPACAGIVAVAAAVVIVLSIMKRKEKNELAKYAEVKSKVDEEYYTQW